MTSLPFYLSGGVSWFQVVPCFAVFAGDLLRRFSTAPFVTVSANYCHATKDGEVLASRSWEINHSMDIYGWTNICPILCVCIYVCTVRYYAVHVVRRKSCFCSLALWFAFCVIWGFWPVHVLLRTILPPRNVTVTRKEAPIPDLHVSRSGAVRHFFSESICIDKYRHFWQKLS